MALDPIDAYMESQGSSEMSLDQTQKDPKERWEWADKLKEKNMVAGQTWYVVSREWWKRWRRACTGEIDKDGPISESDISAVNNTGLVDSYGVLQTGLVDGIDVEFVPSEVWNALVSWYGPALKPLPRKVIERGVAKQTTLELYPPRFKVLRLIKSEPSPTSKHKAAPSITISAHDSVKTLLETARALFTEETTEYRVWKVDTTLLDVEGPEFPISELKLNHGKVIAPSDKTLESAMLDSEDLIVIEFQDADGAWLVDSADMEAAPFRPFESRDGFFNRMGSRPSTEPTTELAPAPKYSFKTTPVRKVVSIDRGTLGLGNMGNTCFMNSALQCLAHQQELCDYFLSGVYEKELNPDNPLGMHGAIAEAFGALLQRIWDANPTSTSYSPREFKMQLQRFAPQFSGYQQHDSQELVAFLLDGLHEDLNRVLKKPYVEKPDWEGGGDLELVKFAQKSWDGYMLRNDSVIVDLFQGQYQSTLVCPVCEKVSITFDPFMYLTLPLPVDKKWRHTVYYIPWDTSKPHVKVPIELGRDSSFKDLRALLLTMEIFSNRFYKKLDDNVLCSEMSDNDTIVCFELPCHAQQSRTYKRQAGDPFILALYLCDITTAQRSNFANRGAPCFGYPAVIAITQEQAKSMDAIYSAVVERLERWTKNGAHLYSWEPGTEETTAIQIGPSSMVPPIDTMAEIVGEENGDVTVRVEEVPSVEEGDITDENIVNAPPTPSLLPPVKKGPKQGTFVLKLQAGHKDFGTTHNVYGQVRFETWSSRLETIDDGILLKQDDALYCEFDENMKALYFGDERSRWDNARWDEWETFVHPEYEAAKKSESEKKHKGLTLQDCLDEFTKEEQLGEDDLWYCPKCKEHRQATKKFDLWSAPDILVVHLKRFSNSRMLRDKIDTFVDFPVEGLDLGEMIGERKVAKRLMEQGADITGLSLNDLDEPLVYDLFGVDEHMGGLGGGHYRAYALNHETQKWYHFDDSFVTPARAQDAVNANAYLLFYRRRSSKPIGRKTYNKIQEWREKLAEQVQDDGEEEVSTNSAEYSETMHVDTSLPTPPSEPEIEYTGRARTLVPYRPSTPTDPRFPLKQADYSFSGMLGLPAEDSGASWDVEVAEPSDGTSPSSSVEAEPDFDFDTNMEPDENFDEGTIDLDVLEDSYEDLPLREAAAAVPPTVISLKDAPPTPPPQ
ncbi:hypothetical protein ONZ45_g4395 [Pleurotus djamor]|nr:hypothetical protein ONZ45_g4395 [Pleurotus djamor]